MYFRRKIHLCAVLCYWAPYALAQNVTQFHNDAARSGAFVVPGLTLAAAAKVIPTKGFTVNTLDGNVTTQPLYWQPASGDAQVIVGTSTNNVYALDSVTGAIVWEQSLGTPWTGSNLACLSAKPTTSSIGIIGAPAIDASGILYTNATLQNGDLAQHEIYALNLNSGGSTVPGWPIDPAALVPGFQDQFLSQHTGVQILNGVAYFTYGSIYRDCDAFQGWIIGVNTANPQQVISFSPTHYFMGTKNSQAAGAGIWGSAGAVSDGTNLFIATGNTKSADGAYSGGEGIFRLAPNLSFTGLTSDYFAPSNWAALDANDYDVGSAAPTLVPVQGDPTYILAVGKAGTGWLVPQNLGGVGGPSLSFQFATNAGGEVINAPAVLPTQAGTYVVLSIDGVNGVGAAGCPAGSPPDSTVETLLITPGPNLQVAWCAVVPNGASAGAPIITTTDGSSNAIAWIVGATGNNDLYGFNLQTGAVLLKKYVGAYVGGRMAPIVAGGHIYVGASGGKVFSFSW